jgi:hypothetical protein
MSSRPRTVCPAAPEQPTGAIGALELAGLQVIAAEELQIVWSATLTASRFVLAVDHDKQLRLFRIDLEWRSLANQAPTNSLGT